MIPQVIHYCWFGKQPMPSREQACIQSWRECMPDYEIKRWDESNFPLDCCSFVKDAYAAKKWAYVSDCARFIILYEHGGIFLDTDVQAVKSFDDLLQEPCFFGVERPRFRVAPGLAVGSQAHNPCIKALRDFYCNSEFPSTQQDLVNITSPKCSSKILKNFGYVPENKLQCLPNVTVYPCDYFAPLNIETGLVEQTSNTYSIHWYSASWMTRGERKWLARKHWLYRKFGVRCGRVLFRIGSLPFRIYLRCKPYAFQKLLRYRISKVKKIRK